MDLSKFLHIVPSDSSAGALKFILPKGTVITTINIALEVDFMPYDLSIDEYENCRDLQLWNYGEDKGFNIFGADLTEFDGVIVWHSTDVRSMLILSLICASYDGNIQVCDVSRCYLDSMVGNLAPVQLKECLNQISPIPNRLRNSLAKKYRQLFDLSPCVKKYSGGRFATISKDELKKHLLQNTKHKPMNWREIISETMRKSKLGEFYSSEFWDCLLLELICEGKLIISEMIMSKSKSHQVPLGRYLTQRYLLNGFDLRQLYSFNCFKPKVKTEFIIKSPRLTQLQVDILNILYDVDAFSSDSEFVKTESAVMIYYSNYSDTANGEPIQNIVDTIYAMAQPWRIKKPLIIARGNMGSKEQCDSAYSGAADMFYTEIALSNYGREVFINYLKTRF